MGAYGIWLSWKHTCGSLNNGIKVPVICKNKRTKEILIVLLNKKNIPINTSHIPIILTHMSGSKKGIQSTVFITNSSAGDIPSGLSIPNQKNITNRDKLSMGTSILIFFTHKKLGLHQILTIIYQCAALSTVMLTSIFTSLFDMRLTKSVSFLCIFCQILTLL